MTYLLRVASGLIVVLTTLTVSAPLEAQARTTVIRTFVNGVASGESEQTVRDLHVEFDRVLSGAGFLGEESLATGADIEIDGRTVEVVFRRDLEPGESVTIQATAEGKTLNIRKWWWTDGEG